MAASPFACTPMRLPSPCTVRTASKSSSVDVVCSPWPSAVGVRLGQQARTAADGAVDERLDADEPQQVVAEAAADAQGTRLRVVVDRQQHADPHRQQALGSGDAAAAPRRPGRSARRRSTSGPPRATGRRRGSGRGAGPPAHSPAAASLRARSPGTRRSSARARPDVRPGGRPRPGRTHRRAVASRTRRCPARAGRGSSRRPSAPRPARRSRDCPGRPGPGPRG